MPPYRRPRRRAGWFRRYVPWLALMLVVLVSGVMGYVLWTLRDVPDPAKAPELSRSITVYDRNGNVIATQNSQGQFYQGLKLSQMGQMNVWATLAAEDRDFYSRSTAIDFTATARAAASDLLQRGNLQGGSTITQQLVKISVLTPQRSIFRKLQEATLAFGLQNNYSKDQILEMYLNRVFYGHNAYGIGAATKVFFGADKNAADLTAGQAAFLAALINGPSYYDPQTNFAAAKQRQLYVLAGMVKTGHLTQAQADQAAQENIQAELKFDQTFFQSKAPHFVTWVIGQAEKMLPADMQQGGVSIYTTLDLNLQQAAQNAVSAGVNNPTLRREGVNNGDLLAADPATGSILAWVGSADYNNDKIAGQVNVVTSPRQPGSSFKPYVYEAALKSHTITLSSTLQDKPTDFGGGYMPVDFDNQYLGNITARRCLVLSRNVCTVQTAQMVGMNAVIQEAQAQGVTHTTLSPQLGTAIGGSDVTMFDQVQGYQVFANQGKLMPLMAITKITDGEGNVLVQQQPGTQPNSSQPMTAAEAYLITSVLKNYSATWDLGWKRTMAGKSGTTGGAITGVHRDAWMMAYNKDIVVGAWAGNTAPNTVNGGAGTNISTFGTEVGQTIMKQFVNGLPGNMNGWFTQPDGIVTGRGCPGALTGTEVYLAGTENGVNCPAYTPPVDQSPTPQPQQPRQQPPQPQPPNPRQGGPNPTPIVPLPFPTGSPTGTPNVINPTPTPALPVGG